MPCWQLIAPSASKYDDDSNLRIIMIIFFAAIIVPIQDLCRPLCGRKSNVYQTSLLNICGDKILHRLNISEKIFHLLNYFWGQNFVLSCTSSGTKYPHDCGDGFWRSTKYEGTRSTNYGGTGTLYPNKGKTTTGKNLITLLLLLT